jgi:hypothetical protein
LVATFLRNGTMEFEASCMMLGTYDGRSQIGGAKRCAAAIPGHAWAKGWWLIGFKAREHKCG